VARENACRVLSEWRRRKFVTGSSHRPCINNIAAIKREMDLTDGSHARPCAASRAMSAPI
jgi:hypothetical protein